MILGAVLLASAAAAGATPPPTVSCASAAGGRNHCPAETSRGVVLLKATGTGTCLLGRTWGYDDEGVWVSDGCAGEFVVVPEGIPLIKGSASQSYRYIRREVYLSRQKGETHKCKEST